MDCASLASPPLTAGAGCIAARSLATASSSALPGTEGLPNESMTFLNSVLKMPSASIRLAPYFSP